MCRAQPVYTTPACMQEQYKNTTQQIMAHHKTGPLHMLYPILFQLPVFTGYYFALSAMCNAHLPSMVVDAAPYGFDLTTVDPYHALNVSVPLSLMAVVRNTPPPPLPYPPDPNVYIAGWTCSLAGPRGCAAGLCSGWNGVPALRRRSVCC